MQKMSPNQQLAAKNLLSKKGALGFTDHKIYQRQNEADLVLSKPIGKSGRFTMTLTLTDDGLPILSINDKYVEPGFTSTPVTNAIKKAGHQLFKYDDIQGIKKWLNDAEKHLSNELKLANKEF